MLLESKPCSPATFSHIILTFALFKLFQILYSNATDLKLVSSTYFSPLFPFLVLTKHKSLNLRVGKLAISLHHSFICSWMVRSICIMSLGVKGLISTSKSGYLHLLVHLFYLFVIVGVILEVARPFRVTKNQEHTVSQSTCWQSVDGILLIGHATINQFPFTWLDPRVEGYLPIYDIGLYKRLIAQNWYPFFPPA